MQEFLSNLFKNLKALFVNKMVFKFPTEPARKPSDILIQSPGYEGYVRSVCVNDFDQLSEQKQEIILRNAYDYFADNLIDFTVTKAVYQVITDRHGNILLGNLKEVA